MKTPFVGFKTVQAKGKFAIVRIHEHEKTANAGLHLPEEFRQGIPPWGEVISIGPDCKTCEPGQIVYCQARRYQAIHVGAEALYAIDSESVIAVCEPSEAMVEIMTRKSEARRVEESGLVLAAN